MIALAAVLLAASYNFSQALTVGAIGAVAGGIFWACKQIFSKENRPIAEKPASEPFSTMDITTAKDHGDGNHVRVCAQPSAPARLT